jgi:dihydroorotate dehydrogenase electron transfer subunit
LGSAFSPGREEISVLVAGGRGVAPLIFLAEALAGEGREFVALVGARVEGDLYWDGAMDRAKVKITTEDGSAGVKGLVTDLLEPQLAGLRGAAAVYCCGPVKMLRSVSEICAARGTPCQASVETVFACGVGVCRGCVVPRANGDAPYLMACSDGPVLRAEEVNWELFAP